MSSMRTATLSNINHQRQATNMTPVGEFATIAQGPETTLSPINHQPTSFLATLEANIAPKYKHGMQLCIGCLDHLCGRYEKQHAIEHYLNMKKNGH